MRTPDFSDSPWKRDLSSSQIVEDYCAPVLNPRFEVSLYRNRSIDDIRDRLELRRRFIFGGCVYDGK